MKGRKNVTSKRGRKLVRSSELELTDHVTHRSLSESSSFIAEKLAFPTPTMMMDNGRREAAMMAFLVSVISEIAPSVSMSKTKYC